MRRFFKILFLIIALLNILEYLYIAGLFTAPIMMIASMAVGLVNILFCIKEKSYHDALLYLTTTIALNMGYWKLL